MEINLKEKYLPIGTVVLLKGAKKRIMITGFCVVAPDVEGKMFDYCGCIYPEGYLNSTQNCLFNHQQIDKVYHVGLVDEEENKFKAQLKQISPIVEDEFKKYVAQKADGKGQAPVPPTPPTPPAAPVPPTPPVPPVAPVSPVAEPSPQVQPTAPAAPAAQPNPTPTTNENQPSVINFMDNTDNKASN